MTSTMELASSIRYPSYRLFRLPTVKRLEAPKQVNEVERPVWFAVLPGGPTGTELEGRGPFTIQELRAKWSDGSLTGETLVWTSDKPYDEWATIDSNRRLKELLLRTMLPTLPSEQIEKMNVILDWVDEEEDEDDDEDDDNHGTKGGKAHEGKPLKVLDYRLLCADCGALGSLGCRACKDGRVEAKNGVHERVGSLEDAVEVVPSFLWFGEEKAATRKVVDDLSITHLINVSQDLPNTVDADMEQTVAFKTMQLATQRIEAAASTRLLQLSNSGPESREGSQGRILGKMKTGSTKKDMYITKLPDGRDMPGDLTSIGTKRLVETGSTSTKMLAMGDSKKTLMMAESGSSKGRTLRKSPTGMLSPAMSSGSLAASPANGTTRAATTTTNRTMRSREGSPVGLAGGAMPMGRTMSSRVPKGGVTVREMKEMKKQQLCKTAKDIFKTQAAMDKKVMEEQAARDDIKKNLRRVSIIQLAPVDRLNMDMSRLLMQFDACYNYIECVRAMNLGYQVKDESETMLLAGANRVLVYSMRGDTLSAMVVMAYLIRGLGFTLENCLSFIMRINSAFEVSEPGRAALARYESLYTTGCILCPDCYDARHGHLGVDPRGVRTSQLVVDSVDAAAAVMLRTTRRKKKGGGKDAAVPSGPPGPSPRVDLRGESFEDESSLERFTRALGQWPQLNGGGPMLMDFSGVRLGDSGVQSLSEAFLQAGSPSLTVLILANNHVSDEGASLLLNTINLSLDESHRPSLTHLDLSGNHLGLQTAQALHDYLKDDACMLMSLSLACTAMGDEAVSKVVDALSPPEYAQLLSLTEPGSEDGPGLKRRALMLSRTGGAAGHHAAVPCFHDAPTVQRLKIYNTTLTSLDLGANGLGDQSYLRLKHAMRDNQVLCSLSLGGNSHHGSSESGDVTDEYLEFLRYAAVYPTELTALNLSRCGLQPEVGAALSRIVGQEHCRLEHLDLSFNHLDASSLEDVTIELKSRLTQTYITGNHLMTLDLSSNVAVGTRGAILLAEVFLGRNLRMGQLEENMTEAGRLRLQNIYMSGCGIGPKGFMAFAEVLQMRSCPLRTLDLSENQLGSRTEAMAAMGEAMAVNRSLVSLDLCHTGMSIDGVKGLIKGLRLNNFLERLSLARNTIRDLGARALARLLSDGQGMMLQEVDLSSCAIGEEGLSALYESLKTYSSDHRDKKCLELNLIMGGNASTIDLRKYVPDAPLTTPPPFDSLVMPPHLARSKQTVHYACLPYLDPVHDVSAWSRRSQDQNHNPPTAHTITTSSTSGLVRAEGSSSRKTSWELEGSSWSSSRPESPGPVRSLNGSLSQMEMMALTSRLAVMKGGS